MPSSLPVPLENPALAPVEPLWNAFHQKILPWSSEPNAMRCIIATPTLAALRASNATLPEEVAVSARKWRGKKVRVPKSHQRMGGKMATYLWPDDGLLSKRVPQLACILSGRADFRAGDYILHIPAGYFVIIPPGVPYPDGSRGHTEGQGACDILWLTLWSDILRCWICHSRDEEHLPSIRADSCFIREPQVSAYLQALSAEAAGREAGYEAVCRNLLGAIWTVLHRRIGNGQFFQNDRFAFGEQQPLIQADDPISLAQHYIRSHLHQRLTLAAVAQQVYLSRAQFARRFHQETGQTFNTFVTQCRLQQSRKLLIETQWPLTTIGEIIGLTPAHLSAVFLRHMGQSPREFRRAERNSSSSDNRDDYQGDETITAFKSSE